MASIAAKAVAEEVLEVIGKGEIPNITKIAVKQGYSPTTSRAGRVQQTKTFKKIVGNALDNFENERAAIFKEMERKRKKAPYSSLVGGLEVTSKNIQLLTGGKTDNVGIEEDRKILIAILAEIRNK